MTTHPAPCLLRGIHRLVTMAEPGEVADCDVLVSDGLVRAINPAEVPDGATVVDLRDHVVLPGFVNTHHHLFQNLTRVLRPGQDCDLFGWLKACYPVWLGLDGAATHAAAKVGMAELLRHGCTTTSDHHYLYPNDTLLDDSIRAAQELGMRFVATRGGMDVGVSAGGLPPDEAVEKLDAILADTERCITTHHDPGHGALVQVGVAPCSPFTASHDLMVESARLARHHGVRLHTHLAENADDITYSREVHGMAPGEYAEHLGFAGPDVWHAHCVHLDAAESARCAATGTAIAHCPTSNMRLGSGIAPLCRWLDQGVTVGLGVDGSSSNDGASVLSEARQAMMLQRVVHGAAALDARQALELATRGGARALGRDELGHVRPGDPADLVAYDLNKLEHAGTSDDPVAAVVFCLPGPADFVMVHGRRVIEQGWFTELDVPALLEVHAGHSRRLLNR